jgi:hypothetical protein
MKSTKLQPPTTQEEFETRLAELRKEDLLSPLRDFHSVLWDAFLDAQVRTNEGVKGAANRRAIRNFYPVSMRFHVLNFLSQKGIKSRLLNERDEEMGEEEDWKPDVLANNGIGGIVDGHEIRILKMYRGGLPPATSQARKQFYNQSHLRMYQPRLPLPLEDSGPDYVAFKPNVVYLWDITKGRLGLHYAVPKHYSLYDSTELINIPNPLTEINEALAWAEAGHHVTMIVSPFGHSKIIKED